MLAISVVVGLVLLAFPLPFGVGEVGQPALQSLLLVLIGASFLAVGSMLAAVIPKPRVASGVGARATHSPARLTTRTDSNILSTSLSCDTVRLRDV